LKSGRSAVGAHAAASHTGALAASDLAVDALLAQAGVLRAGAIEELFDMAMAFSAAALPRSRRTAVLTNSGGPGILLADALEPYNIELVDLHPSTVEKLQTVLPPEASLRNPLDMIASATPASYRTTLEALLADPNIDAAISIFVPPIGIQQTAVVESVVAAASTAPEKPVIAVLMGREGLPQGRAELSDAKVPAYVFPESAARGLAALNHQREWLQRPVQTCKPLEVDAARGRSIVAKAIAENRTRLDELEALELLEAYGINTARAEIAASTSHAREIAERLGYPVVMKVVSAAIMHKTDVGGVRVGLNNAEEVRTAFLEIEAAALSAAPGARIDGILVQRMLKGGPELIAGVTRDPLFGPLVMFGLGGIYAEALRDVTFRIAPVGEAEAADMIAGIRAQKMLTGMRGRPPVDLEALKDLLRRVSQLAVDIPEIGELDLNPILPGTHGVTAVDARVKLGS
jgi:acetyltransferase